MKTEAEFIAEIERVNATDGCLDALPLLEEALAKYPNSAHLLHVNGMNLFALKRFEEALASFKKAAELEPVDDVHLNSVGKTLNVLERYEEALQYFGKAVEIAFNNRWVRPVAPDAEDGRPRLEMRFAPAMDLFYNVAEALSCSGEHERALDFLEWVMDLKEPPRYFDFVDMAEAQFLKAGILDALEKDDESLAAYEEGLRYLDVAIGMEPSDGCIWQIKGEVLKDLGRDDEAMECFRKAKEIEPDIYIPEIDGELPGRGR